MNDFLGVPMKHARRFSDTLQAKCGRAAGYFLTGAVSYVGGSLSHGQGVNDLYRRGAEITVTVVATLGLMWKGLEAMLKMQDETVEKLKELKEAQEDLLQECRSDRAALHEKLEAQEGQIRELREEMAKMQALGQVQA